MFSQWKNLDELIEIFDKVSREFTQEANNQTLFGDYNLYEDAENAYLEVLLPGFEKSEIASVIKDNILTIKAEKLKGVHKEYIVKNLSITDKEYKITLRSDIAGGIWTAELKNGILKYTIEKQKPIKDDGMYISII